MEMQTSAVAFARSANGATLAAKAFASTAPAQSVLRLSWGGQRTGRFWADVPGKRPFICAHELWQQRTLTSAIQIIVAASRKLTVC
ncbi:hypothetical protein X737_26685 [Mesorhizobium sp. L48C026A00]|nr:hypothetical protein X737_26685 [Mesorhizobium sp. L48C026A00]